MREAGRRERKRRATRDRIAIAARELFSARGFDGVTVAEVAEAADVSEQTVYNHFPTKEDLVFWRRGAFEEGLVEAVRDRPVGQSATAALHGYLVETVRAASSAPSDSGQEVGGGSAPAFPSTSTLTAGSPSLHARELSLVADHTAALAAVLAADTDADPGSLEPRMAAAAMFAIAHSLIERARHRVIAGARPPSLTDELEKAADRAIELLDRGLEGYAVRGQVVRT